MNAVPSSYMILAWKLSAKIASLSLLSEDSFWNTVKTGLNHPYFYSDDSLIKQDFDLIILPDPMTIEPILSIAESKECLSKLTTSYGCSFLPGLDEYFELADKYAVHSRLKWK